MDKKIFIYANDTKMSKTIEETLGIKINNYIAINNEGVRKIVDALGGIPVYIEKNMWNKKTS